MVKCIQDIFGKPREPREQLKKMYSYVYSEEMFNTKKKAFYNKESIEIKLMRSFRSKNYVKFIYQKSDIDCES